MKFTKLNFSLFITLTASLYFVLALVAACLFSKQIEIHVTGVCFFVESVILRVTGLFNNW